MPNLPTPSSESADRSAGDPQHLNDRQAPDSLDQQILGLLQTDGRMSYRKIARELDVSEGTIRFRVNRLQDSGALTIIAIADPFQMGYRILAFVLLRSAPGKQASVIEEISTWDEATYVSSLASTSDIYFQFVSRDNDHLNEILHERIAGIDGVLSFETHMELKIHKVSYGYPIMRFGQK
ncbi:Lrp/AsnC family transcriptional regulator [Leucobacter sp. M11]|uniref:Lrp/AsnC family transcriptional regulator n=1 Tax=Leucobacter sp. M11 TaxID=2993565 RepID=UPI002D7E1CA4|nr:Lrp/AsnC family transcriptional regulator [Leucobacter sp. M11]MEB4616498.1 Lrp/AsnC family transcriptional regulator [Leucobacter sp. M11]